jgi:hypothetical protein
MARYSAFLGRPVEVQYRAGDICLPASGVFVGDSGRSIFLEQHYEQHGQPKNFRWEIPYPCIVRLEAPQSSRKLTPSDATQAAEISTPQNSRVHASAAHAPGGGVAMLPATHRPKTS